MVADILIVDDEADIRELISGVLEDEGYETRLAHNSDAALAELSQRRPTLVVLDIWLQGSKLDGLDLLLEIKQLAPELPSNALITRLAQGTWDGERILDPLAD